MMWTNTDNTVMLDDLVGDHIIDAVGEFVAKSPSGYGEDSRVFMLRIDGVVHVFAEDVSDYARSSLERIDRVAGDEVDGHRVVPFPPMAVNFVKRPGEHHHTIAVIDERTNLGVLEIGTEDWDDYYPTFVAHWQPEGFKVNWLVPDEDDD